MATYKTGEVLLQVNNIALTLGGNQILKGVNATIHDLQDPGGKVRGQIVGFIGPSGVGKTQLSKVMSGLQKPDEGQVLLNMESAPVQAGLVGMVMQHYPLLNHRSVLGNCVLAGKMAGLTKAQAKEKALELLKRFGLLDRAYYDPRDLSGGQKQRVAIIQQLMCSERFLIMDEPFSGLDPTAKRAAMSLIMEVANLDERNTIVVISHDITSVAKIADHIWVMGRQVATDGSKIPGSHIVHEYNLIEMGFAWREDVDLDDIPEFRAFTKELDRMFDIL